jgi:hypothetical protein
MPSLLGTGRRNNSGSVERSDAQDTRILWALASDTDLAPPTHKKRSNSGRRWMLALLLLVAVGGSLAWWQHTPPEPSAQLASATPVAQAAPLGAAEAASAPATADAASAVAPGALLIDVPQAAASAVPNTEAAGSPLAALTTPNDSAAPAPAAAPATRKPVATAPQHVKREAGKKTVVAQGKAREAAPASSTAQPRSVAAARTPDADVALLEAMVTHISSGQRSHADTGRTSAPRGSRLSTREQLKRCKAQSGADASACRAKVCSGRWGADPECSSLPRSTL